jgi:hypothetical protein|nr:MAG TPA: hypothetical protein [Caudoviricetes sp.]
MIKFGQNVYREHYLFRLPDGFRVSVAKGYYSTYGGDVLGYLTDVNVIDILAELKRRHKHRRTITHMFNTVILRDEESD